MSILLVGKHMCSDLYGVETSVLRDHSYLSNILTVICRYHHYEMHAGGPEVQEPNAEGTGFVSFSSLIRASPDDALGASRITLSAFPSHGYVSFDLHLIRDVDLGDPLHQVGWFIHDFLIEALRADANLSSFRVVDRPSVLTSRFPATKEEEEPIEG